MKPTVAIRVLVAAAAATGSIAVLGAAHAQGPVGQGNPDADAFACPVLGGHAGERGHEFVEIGEGGYTVLGPNVKVPDHATNNDGAGSPADHLSPGEVGYSPIWDDLTN
ncbi:MAG: hypothetical protein AB7P41_14190 [Dehalococcoidia bacterium]